MTQLVECMLCKHKVIGSIPIISIYLARLVELVDTSDLKSDSIKSIGSSPVTSIINTFYSK